MIRPPAVARDRPGAVAGVVAAMIDLGDLGPAIDRSTNNMDVNFARVDLFSNT